MPFFIGLGVGLAALSWLGATVESTRLTHNFVRFHQHVDAESGYVPTARQIRSIVDAQAEGPPAVFVVVGGTSVFQGAGQHESLIWTKFLQQNLGARFRVVNLAQRGGRASDFGNIAAEFLIKQKRPVIFVADGSTNVFASRLEASPYRQTIFDAWYRGYLLPWPPRDRLLSNAAWYGPDALQASALGAMLNSYLNFNDFWNYAGYEYVNLNWNALLGARFGRRSFGPRADLGDPELMPEQYAARQGSQDRNRVMQLIRSAVEGLTDPRWGPYKESADQMIPPRLRAVTLAVLRLENPYYRDQFEPAETEAYRARIEDRMRQLQELGFNRVILPTKEFTEADYVDGVHLSVIGGQKLAAEMAPVIRAMATQLGYLP